MLPDEGKRGAPGNELDPNVEGPLTNDSAVAKGGATGPVAIGKEEKGLVRGAAICPVTGKDPGSAPGGGGLELLTGRGKDPEEGFLDPKGEGF